jgi:hypothetical protein
MKYIIIILALFLQLFLSFKLLVKKNNLKDKNTPSIKPSIKPSNTPSIKPSNTPSIRPSNTPYITPSNTPSNPIYIDIYESKDGLVSLIDKWIKIKDNDINKPYDFTGYFKSHFDNREINLDLKNKSRPIITVIDRNNVNNCDLCPILEGDSPNPIGLIRDKYDFILTDLTTNTPFGKWSLIKMNNEYMYEPILNLKKGYITYKVLNLDNSDKNKRVILPLIFKKDKNSYKIITIDKNEVEENNYYICQQPLNSPSPSSTNMCYKIIKSIEYVGLGVMIKLDDTKYGLYHNITNTRAL